ncbi:MAG: ABC transporter ATP-binding protein [Planctomycetales bacterium]|nr:ABC transporter ATP-binding protein [Planctomycetales bacterium]MCA9166184.1 ABC transporter ATP-binding protein [Planctomycetales bacterium]
MSSSTSRNDTPSSSGRHARDVTGGAGVLLKLVDVDKTYRMGDVDVPVLHHVNLRIEEGQITVIVGPSGSGKSTLLNLVGGIDRPTSGSVFFRGHDISDYSERQLTDYRRDRIGFVFQFYNLVSTLTALENVRVSTEIVRDAMAPQDALQLVGLSHRLDHFPAQLSGGEQQRVAIARAVAKKPDLLLCDEPTGALDLATGRKVLRALVELNTNMKMSIIIITHNVAIAGIAHRLVRIGSGTIAEDVAVEQRIEPEDVAW